jgi:hypothetical protein
MRDTLRGGLVVMQCAADAAGWLQARWRCHAFEHGLKGV